MNLTNISVTNYRVLYSVFCLYTLMSRPNGVAVDAAGNTYVVDTPVTTAC